MPCTIYDVQDTVEVTPHQHSSLVCWSWHAGWQDLSKEGGACSCLCWGIDIDDGQAQARKGEINTQDPALRSRDR
jgi:hypothetical protein